MHASSADSLEAWSASSDRDWEDWRQPDPLEAPPHRPGFEQRWVYCGPDEDYARKCWSRAIRTEGYRPREADAQTYADNVPWLPDHAPQVDAADRYIRSGHMILMERPIEIGNKRRAYYARQNRLRIEQLEVNLQEETNGAAEREFDVRSTVGRPDAALNLPGQGRIPPTGD